MVEINKRIGGPQLGPQLLPADYFAGALQQTKKDLKGLLLKPNLRTIPPEFSGLQVELEDAEVDRSASV